MRLGTWVVVGLVGGCTSAPEPEEPGVLKDCEAVEGDICPYAGVGRNGFNGDGKDRLDSWFSLPMSITFSPYGNPVIADWNNHKLRLVEDDGTLRTIMGTSLLGDGDPDKLDLTPEGAPGTTVNLNHPTQQVYMADGTLLSASWHTHKLRTWDPATGKVHVYLGGAPGFNEPPEAEAGLAYPAESCKLNQPSQVALDENEDIFILDMRNERVRFFDREAATVATIAGNGTKAYCGEGPLLETCFNFPKNANPEPGGALAYDAEASLLYVADTESHVIRVLDLEAGVSSLVAGSPGEPGDADGAGPDARFDWPSSLALDGDTLFVADANNHKVRAIDLTSGAVSTFAGTGEPTCEIPGHDIAVPGLCDDQFLSGDGGPATEAKLYRPFGVALDLDGNVVIADTYNNRFRVVYR